VRFRTLLGLAGLVAVGAGFAACHGLKIAYEDCLDFIDEGGTPVTEGCEDGTQCFDVVRGGTGGRAFMCSNGCTTDDECFDNGVCASIEGSSTICMQRCSERRPCRHAGLACMPLEGSETSVCFPE
jgi:hypothetical protein